MVACTMNNMIMSEEGPEKWSRWHWSFEIIKSDKLDLRFSSFLIRVVATFSYLGEHLVTELFFFTLKSKFVIQDTCDWPLQYFFYCKSLMVFDVPVVLLNCLMLMIEYVASKCTHTQFQAWVVLRVANMPTAAIDMKNFRVNGTAGYECNQIFN